ncbi:DUF6308 family protein [Streptomyces sp. NPDC093018]|uniref:DUF6308 family protein n=1 Tax=Streptomyces sp. NPDC093018 TaxID=3155067 RepID=UPI0034154B73
MRSRNLSEAGATGHHGSTVSRPRLLRADSHALHRELMALRQAAELPATVSVLRVCDVVLWMHHRTDHQQRGCRSWQQPVSQSASQPARQPVGVSLGPAAPR